MPPIELTSPRSIASAWSGEPRKPEITLIFVLIRSLSAAGMKFEVLDGTVPAIRISRSFACSMVCTGEVCQTTDTVAVETMRPIQTSLTGSKSPWPPSTLPSVSASRKRPSEVPSCGVTVDM